MIESVNLDEYEDAARERLDPVSFDYIAGGAEDEATLQRNRDAYARYLLRPRALAGIEHVDLSTTVLGTPVSTPILIAPAAYHCLCDPEGEVATARAAQSAGTLMVASTLATRTLEDIAAVGGPVWFQLYVYRDRAVTESLVRRAEAAGYHALVLTADTPVLGRRERDVRNHFSLPAGLQMANFADPALSQFLPAGGSELAAYVGSAIDPALSWRDIAWLRSITSLPVVVKGVMCAEDARLAVEHGAAAVVVSNHGGRQLDSAPSTIEVLEEVVAAVGGRCEVYLDGGVRRGTDVVKALALGARAVLIGRPYLWGLAVAGEAGARRVLDLLTAETEMALRLTGCVGASSVVRDVVRRA